jgi:phosphoadenosine phosphosulfate reductase
LVQTRDGSVKIYTDGTIQINASDKESAGKLFTAAAHQLIRSVKCTGCGICEKACPHSAIMVRDKHVRVNEKCDRCGRCDDVCVVTRYLDKMVPGLLPDNI